MNRKHEVLASITALTLAGFVLAAASSHGEKGEAKPVAVSHNMNSKLLFKDAAGRARHHSWTTACSVLPSAHVSAYPDAPSTSATMMYTLGLTTPPFPEKPSEADLAIVAQVIGGQFVEVVTENDEPGTSTIVATDLGSYSTILNDKFGYPMRMVVEQTPEDRQMITLSCT